MNIEIIQCICFISRVFTYKYESIINLVKVNIFSLSLFYWIGFISNMTISSVYQSYQEVYIFL